MAKVKVSQATIDKIKSMGMTAALKKAPNASPEMKEALTRMYGAKRVAAAGGKPATKPAAKSADAARMSAKPVMTKSAAKPVKKSGTTDPFARAVFSVGNKISNNGAGASTRKPVAGKPSVGEKISAAFTGKGVGNRTTAESVAAINAKRLGISVAEYNKRLATAKKK